MRQIRYAHQLQHVKTHMLDGKWHTLQELSEVTGAPEASVSARLRDLRKAPNGSHTVFRRPCYRSEHPVFEYRLTLRTEPLPKPKPTRSDQLALGL